MEETGKKTTRCLRGLEGEGKKSVEIDDWAASLKDQRKQRLGERRGRGARGEENEKP